MRSTLLGLCLLVAGCGNGLPFPTGPSETNRGDSGAAKPAVSVVQSCLDKQTAPSAPVTVTATNNCDKHVEAAPASE